MVAVLKPDLDIQDDTGALYDFARKALEESEGNWQSAVDLYTTWLLEDAILRETLLPAIVRQGARRYVHNAMHRAREVHWSGAPNPDDASGLAAVAMRSLLDYPMRPGIRLGDATRDLLLAEAAYHRKLARTNHIRGVWYASIAAKLPDDATIVQAVFSHTELEALQRAAEAE